MAANFDPHAGIRRTMQRDIAKKNAYDAGYICGTRGGDDTENPWAARRGNFVSRLRDAWHEGWALGWCHYMRDMSKGATP